MRFLYLAFIASIAALLWAAWAMARTIRRHGRVEPSLTLTPRDKTESRDAGADLGIDPTSDQGRPGKA